jgi:TonB family protein
VAAPIAAVAVTEPAAELVTTTAGVDVVLVAPEPRATTATPAPQPAAEPAQQSPGSVSGIVRDSSGGVMPGVAMTLTGTRGGTVYDRWSDALGAFTFTDLPPGRYSLVAALPGFTTLEIDLELGAGEHLQRRLSMLIGRLQETTTVLCGSGAAALPAGARGVLASARRAATRASWFLPAAQDVPRAQDARAAAQVPVRVGGNVRAPRKVRHVSPLCPQTLLPPPGGTLAILEAVLGPDGAVQSIKVLREPTPAALADSAVDAIRQWQFTPTLLNNVPVPIIMTVTVVFDRE